MEKEEALYKDGVVERILKTTAELEDGLKIINMTLERLEQQKSFIIEELESRRKEK